MTDPDPSRSGPVGGATSPPSADRTSGRGRSIVAGIAGAVAVLGLVGGIVGFWTLDTASDSERFEEQVADLLEDEEISDALARRVVNDLAAVLELREAAVAIMPEVLEPAVDLLLAGVRSRVEDRTAELIRTPAVTERVAAAAGRAHAAAIDVVEGESVVDGVTVVDGEVSVNLLPLMSRAITTLQELGLFRNVVIPEIDRTGDPTEQRDQLAAALGRELPADFGEPVVFRSESLDQVGDTVALVRDVLVLTKRAFWLLLIGGVGLAAVSIWLSANRWRSASFLVAGLFLMTLLLRLVTARAISRLPDVVESPGAREAVRQLADDLEDSLNQTMGWYAAIALLVLVVAAAVQFGLPARRRRAA